MKTIWLKDYYDNPCGDMEAVEVSDEVYHALMEEAKEWKRLKKQDRHIACSYADGETDWNLRRMWVMDEDIVMQRETEREMRQELKKQLTHAQRHRIEARFFIDLKVCDIARNEGVTTAVISVSISDSLKKLKRFFKKG